MSSPPFVAIRCSLFRISVRVDSPAPIRTLPLFRAFTTAPRRSPYAPASLRSRLEISSNQFSPRSAHRRTFASSPVVGAIATETPAASEPSLEELAQRALEQENATRQVDVVPAVAAAPPPPDALLPSDTLLDAANIDYLSLSGTLDLSSLPGSYGFHPIMRMQSMFLHLHESFPLLGHGLPWYILIPTVTICLRLLLFTFQVRAQSNAARMAIIQPQMLAGMEKLKAAKARGDFMGAQTAQIETQTLMRDNNVNPIKNLAFPLAQATVFMTMFFALKGLAGAEIPSMTTEGLAWMENLTLPDPYWVLPVASTALTLATLEVSRSSRRYWTSSLISTIFVARCRFDDAGTDVDDEEHEAVLPSHARRRTPLHRLLPCRESNLKIILRCADPLHQALLLYWVTNNSISLLQSLLLKQPVVRGIFGIPTIPPKIQPGEKGYVPEPSFSEAFKNVQIGIADKWEQTKEDGEKEAARRKSFEVAEARSERAPVYAPRAPMPKKMGLVDQAAKGLTETFGEQKAVVEISPREKRLRAFESEKQKRATANRDRRNKA